MNFIETAMSCLPFYLAFMIANRKDLACQSDLEMGRGEKPAQNLSVILSQMMFGSNSMQFIFIYCPPYRLLQSSLQGESIIRS